jgi:hypothetical protein
MPRSERAVNPKLIKALAVALLAASIVAAGFARADCRTEK